MLRSLYWFGYFDLVGLDCWIPCWFEFWLFMFVDGLLLWVCRFLGVGGVLFVVTLVCGIMGLFVLVVLGF